MRKNEDPQKELKKTRRFESIGLFFILFFDIIEAIAGIFL